MAFGQEGDRDDDVGDPVPPQQRDDVFHHRPPDEGKHRLGQVGRLGAQPCALAAGHDDRLHTALLRAARPSREGPPRRCRHSSPPPTRPARGRPGPSPTRSPEWAPARTPSRRPGERPGRRTSNRTCPLCRPTRHRCAPRPLRPAARPSPTPGPHGQWWRCRTRGVPRRRSRWRSPPCRRGTGRPSGRAPCRTSTPVRSGAPHGHPPSRWRRARPTRPPPRSAGVPRRATTRRLGCTRAVPS